MFEIDYKMSEFMLDCQVRNLTKKTMASYESTLRFFARYLQDNFKITDGKLLLVKEEMIKINHIYNLLMLVFEKLLVCLINV
jgi:integrase/recombinase XerD